MRGIFTTAAVFAALAIAGSAQAASIRECGSRPAANGYQSIENITSRNVACSQARHVAFVIYCEVGPDNGGYAVCSRSCVVRWTSWRITVRYERDTDDVRATGSGGRVVHFQASGE
jgi:hypothetical protein